MLTLILYWTVALVFIIAGRIEIVIFDRDHDEFARYKINILCIKSGSFKKISQISDIRVVKRGHETTFSKAVYFKIVVDFKDGESIFILDSKKEDKVITQVLLIKKFIGIQDSNFGNRVQIDNEMDIV